MIVSPSALRKDLYKQLDTVIETGIPIQIKRKGKIIKISIDEKPDIFKNLKKHPDVLSCDPKDIVHIDWSSYWNNDLP